MPKRGHEPALDGIRGLAIVAVILTHSSSIFAHSRVNDGIVACFHYGWMGVDLFFVLSGFLITGILLDTIEAENRARSFYARRILRIFPIYYLTLIACMLLGAVSWSAKIGASLAGWKDYLAYLLYFQNWSPLWHGGQIPPSYIGHFWSLGVEEQFYFIWPFVVWRLRSPRRVIVVSLSAAMALLVLRIVLMRIFGNGPWYINLTPTRGDGLLLGAAFAAWSKGNRLPTPRAVAAAFCAGGGFLVWLANTSDRQLWNDGPWLNTVGFSAIALLCTAIVATARMRHFRPLWEARPLTIVGKYSYGLYVYHLPLSYFLGALTWGILGVGPPFRLRYAFPYFLFYLAACFGTAWLSYDLIESRFLRLKRHFEANRPGEKGPSEITATNKVSDDNAYAALTIAAKD
jgi:peptidoglycan/LPS O-acetylase OafA/YrhL